jgi:plasmid maintenance system antidote protein VapI
MRKKEEKNTNKIEGYFTPEQWKQLQDKMDLLALLTEKEIQEEFKNILKK